MQSNKYAIGLQPSSIGRCESWSRSKCFSCAIIGSSIDGKRRTDHPSNHPTTSNDYFSMNPTWPIASFLDIVAICCYAISVSIIINLHRCLWSKPPFLLRASGRYRGSPWWWYLPAQDKSRSLLMEFPWCIMIYICKSNIIYTYVYIYILILYDKCYCIKTYIYI